MFGIQGSPRQHQRTCPQQIRPNVAWFAFYPTFRLTAFAPLPLSLKEQKIQGRIDPLLANVVPLRTVWSPDPVSAVLSHDLDHAVYRSPLPSVTQRNECEIG
jgi:hypothetical protein